MTFMSVGIPLYKAENVAWIALEGLCRQQDIDFEWELVVVEEEERAFGQQRIMEYLPRLQKKGCINITYKSLGQWVPLANKIATIIQNCSSYSRIYIPNAADYFSPPRRLSAIFSAWMDYQFDWYAPTRLILYNLKDGKTIVSDNKGRDRKDDYAGRAISMELLRKAVANIHSKPKGVDGLIWMSVQDAAKERLLMYLDKSDNWRSGLSVEGAGSISKYVKTCFDKPLPHQYPYAYELKDTIPADILFRLRQMALPPCPYASRRAKPKSRSKPFIKAPDKKLKGLPLFNLPLPDVMIKRIMKLPPDEMQRACKDPIGYARKMKWLK